MTFILPHTHECTYFPSSTGVHGGGLGATTQFGHWAAPSRPEKFLLWRCIGDETRWSHMCQTWSQTHQLLSAGKAAQRECRPTRADCVFRCGDLMTCLRGASHVLARELGPGQCRNSPRAAEGWGEWGSWPIHDTQPSGPLFGVGCLGWVGGGGSRPPRPRGAEFRGIPHGTNETCQRASENLRPIVTQTCVGPQSPR